MAEGKVADVKAKPKAPKKPASAVEAVENVGVIQHPDAVGSVVENYALEEFYGEILNAVAIGLLRRGENITVIAETAQNYADVGNAYLDEQPSDKLLFAYSSVRLFAEFCRVLVERGEHINEIFPTAFALTQEIAGKYS